MHGNESTTTKAIIDMLYLMLANSCSGIVKTLLETYSLNIIPMLNPDGSDAYTRLNANSVDLNRDAQNLTQPESQVLRYVFEDLNPDYCFNLHGQRTIFGAGLDGNSAVASFLAPAQDDILSITPNRVEAMRLIAYINENLQKELPHQIGIYDDAFNINCVGDTFQSFGTPTILFEAGHFNNDYQREQSRYFMYKALCFSLDFIMQSKAEESFKTDSYFNIPKNEKCFFDIIISNLQLENESFDLAIQYDEILVDNEIEFIPRILKINSLDNFYAHKKIDFTGKIISYPSKTDINIGSEIDFVIANNEKFSLKIY